MEWTCEIACLMSSFLVVRQILIVDRGFADLELPEFFRVFLFFYFHNDVG